MERRVDVVLQKLALLQIVPPSPGSLGFAGFAFVAVYFALFSRKYQPPLRGTHVRTARHEQSTFLPVRATATSSNR